MPHLMCVRGVVSEVNPHRAGLTHPCGWEGVQVLWRKHPPKRCFLLAKESKMMTADLKTGFMTKQDICHYK